jgi:hypothetical protein
MTKKPYQERTDLEKVQSQWHKLSGLQSRDEWSAAVVRCATAAEIAANYAIRIEFSKRSQLSADFVDSQLRWANGLPNKMERLLLNLTVGEPYLASLKELKKHAGQISALRNQIAHQGEFCNEAEARNTIELARHFIETLVRIYESSFTLKTRRNPQQRRSKS